MPDEQMRSRADKRIRCLLLAFSLLSMVGCSSVSRLFSGAPKDALVINEVVTSNQLSLQDEKYGSPDWIELLNASDGSIRLSNYFITDNVEAPQKAFQLPDVVLGPGDCYLVYASKKSGPDLLGFSLKKGGETLTLLDAHMEQISSLSVPALIRDVSYARRSDGTYGYCDLPTPGQVNTGTIEDALPLSSQLIKESEQQDVSNSADLLITEIVSRNSDSLLVTGCEGCTEWVELFNPNDVPVSLIGYTLTDDMGDGERHDLYDREIAPGQYLIVCCGRKACSAAGHLRVDIGLSAQGEELFLFDSAGNIVDQVPFPALPADVSWAMRSDGSWGYCAKPTPGAGPKDHEILSDPILQPKVMEKPFETVHIHEALYRNERSILDEDGDRSDFAELYNGGETAVELDGWYLSDDPQKLTKWPLHDVSLEPGEYLLVFLSGKDRQEGELHASFSLHAGETLVLYDSVRNVYDGLLIPETSENVSVGRNDAGETVFYSHPTPLEENAYPMTTGK